MQKSIRWIYVAFFVSGATSLIFEILWAKELGFGLGGSLYATSTVIASFMAGLGLGSALVGRLKIHNPWRVYAGIQLAIGVFGCLSLPLLHAIQPLWQLLHDLANPSGSVFLLIRFLAVFILLMIPTTLMGMTLPLVIQSHSLDGQSDLGKSSSWIYGLNTLGAVSGVLLGGFVLIPNLGLKSTSWLAGGLDIVLAISVGLSGAAATAAKNLQAEAPLVRTRATNIYLGLYAISGAAALALEVAWFRLLANIFGSTVYTFTNILSVYLCGLALGAWTAPFWRARFRGKALALLQGLIAAVIPLPLFFVNSLPLLYGRLYWSVGYIPAQWLLSCLLILPGTLLLGALFPLVVEAVQGAQKGAARKISSRVYLFNTAGGIAGSLLAGFFLLPAIGVTATILLLAAINFLLGYGLATLGTFQRTERLYYFGSGAALSVFLLVTLPAPDLNALSRSYFLIMRDRQAIDQADSNESLTRALYFREGLTGTIAVTANDLGNGAIGVKISGKPEASSDPMGNRHLLMLGQLPMLLAEKPEAVAVIGLGTGITAGHVLSHSTARHVDLLEIEPAMVEASEFFNLLNGRPLQDSRLQLHLEDGRTFLQYSRGKFDVITSDPISPLIAGSANLYAREYYALAAKHLTDTGVFCQWIQAAGLSLETYRVALATLRSQFPHVAVFIYGNDTVVVGSLAPLGRSMASLRERWSAAGVQKTLMRFGVSDGSQLMAGFLAGNESVDRFVASTKQLNTDDNAWLEHQMPIDHLKIKEASIAGELIRFFEPSREAEYSVLFGEQPLPLVDPNSSRELFETTSTRARKAMADKNSAQLRSALEVVAAHPAWPNYYPAGVELNKIYLAEKEWSLAIELSRRLQQVSPAFAIAFRQEADAHLGQGDKVAAEAALSTGRIYNSDELLR